MFFFKLTIFIYQIKYYNTRRKNIKNKEKNMNHRKSLLTTSIIISIFGLAQATDYKIVVSQQKHNYDIIENPVPVATNWTDKGSEYNCVKTINENDVNLGM